MVPTVSHFFAAVALRLWMGHARCRRSGLLVTFRLPRLGLGFLGGRTAGPGNRAGDRNGLNGHLVSSDQSSFGLLRVDFHGAEFAVLAVVTEGLPCAEKVRDASGAVNGETPIATIS